MTKNELTRTSKYWNDGATQDLAAAGDIISKTTRYSSGLFFLHLSVEKKLKAIFVSKFQSHPPYTHNLGYLADKCELGLKPVHLKLLTTINEFNLSTRYPIDKIKTTRKFNKDYAKRWLEKVKKLHQFLDTF